MATDFGTLQFPMGNSSFAGKDSFALALNFKAVPYSNKQSIRSNAPGGKTFADITLPMPKGMQSNTNITYSEGESETTGGLFDPTSGGFLQSVFTLGGATTFFKDITGIAAFAGQRPMDERDSIFKGAQMRKHSFSWTLVPKESNDAKQIKEIAQAFQTLAYPFMSDNQTYSRVIHPPIWHISALDLFNGRSGAFQFDMGPLPSVLSNVSIKTTEGGVYVKNAGGRAFPASTTISVEYVELEPAVATGRHIQSRSQLRNGAPIGGE